MERSLAELSYVSCSSAVLTGRLRRLIHNAAYTARHTMCMAVSYVAGSPALKSYHKRSKQSHWPSLLHCVHTRKSVSSFGVRLPTLVSLRYWLRRKIDSKK
jgi:hypothetical protein